MLNNIDEKDKGLPLPVLMQLSRTGRRKTGPIRTMQLIQRGCGLVLISLALSSCFSTIPEPKYIAPVKKTAAPVPVSRPYLPDGWADITSKAKRPEIKLWLINRDYSGTMVLRELQSDSGTVKSLQSEEINLVAAMSLRSKIPENNPDFRVTRVPSVIDLKRNLASYVYTQNGLLRRVVVFRKQGTILELELMQEQAAAEFDALTNDLVSFATTLYER